MSLPFSKKWDEEEKFVKKIMKKDGLYARVCDDGKLWIRNLPKTYTIFKIGTKSWVECEIKDGYFQSDRDDYIVLIQKKNSILLNENRESIQKAVECLTGFSNLYEQIARVLGDQTTIILASDKKQPVEKVTSTNQNMLKLSTNQYLQRTNDLTLYTFSEDKIVSPGVYFSDYYVPSSFLKENGHVTFRGKGKKFIMNPYSIRVASANTKYVPSTEDGSGRKDEFSRNNSITQLNKKTEGSFTSKTGFDSNHLFTRVFANGTIFNMSDSWDEYSLFVISQSKIDLILDFHNGEYRVKNGDVVMLIPKNPVQFVKSNMKLILSASQISTIALYSLLKEKISSEPFVCCQVKVKH